MYMINPNNIKDTFCIYETGGKLITTFQYNEESHCKTFDTHAECINYQKEILGEEEYYKRKINAFNRNFKKYINNLLDDNKQKIWIKVCKLFSGSGNNISRKSHIFKEKTITLYDVYMQLERQEWKCYYSKMDFNLDVEYLNPSIDRTDSTNTQSYHKDNITIVTQFVQFFKNAYPVDEMKRAIKSSHVGILDETVCNTNKLIGGGAKKGIKPWKQINLDRPIHMSNYQYYIYEVLKNIDEYLCRAQIEDKVNKMFGIEVRKKALNQPLKNLEESGYLLVDKNKKNMYKYKLKSIFDIRKINECIKIECGHCKKPINILELRARNARGNKGLDLNLYHTICTPCNTASTNRYKNKDLCTFILRQITGRGKKGNITKENFYEIKGSDCRCAITGIQLLHETCSGKFNQASPDRINNDGNYNVDNVQIICLSFNFAKKQFNITNDCIKDIINNIYRNIDNF